MKKVIIWVLTFLILIGCRNETEVNKIKESKKQDKDKIQVKIDKTQVAKVAKDEVNQNDKLKPKNHKREPNKFFAHRGLLNFAPENTLLSIEIAKERGFKNIELDIVTTKGNKIVVFHDMNLKRMFNIDRDVCEVNYEELLKLKPSQHFFEAVLVLPKEQIDYIRSVDDPWIKEIDSQKISLLDDVFKTFDKDFNYHLDIKTLGCEEELHQELVSIIENYALENNVYIESTRLKLLEKIIAINPKIKTIYWNEKIFSFSDEEWQELEEKGIDSVDSHYSNINKNKALKRNSRITNIKVHTYTVNSFKIIEGLDDHVDYIITDLDIFEKNIDKYQFFNQKSQKIKLSSP